MRKLIQLGFLVLVVAASPPAAWSAEPKSEATLKWEYRVLTKEQLLDLGKKDLAAGLNALGDEGWELIAVEPSYIFKRPKGQAARHVEDVKRRVTLATADVEMWKDRAAWAERMVKKGFMTDRQLQQERAQLQAAELALEALKKELDTLPKESKPEEK